jgi:hypothetical protein
MMRTALVGVAILSGLAVGGWNGRYDLPPSCPDGTPAFPFIGQPDPIPRRWLCPGVDPTQDPETCAEPLIVCLPWDAAAGYEFAP